VEREDLVAVDEAVCIFINGELLRTLIATPDMIKELVVGHLITENIVESMTEINEIEVRPLKVYVELKKRVDLKKLSMNRVDLITTACGSAAVQFRRAEQSSERKKDDVKVNYETVLEMVRSLNEKSTLFRRTGGTHSAMLCSQSGEALAFAEDVGRHNAIDKVIGSGILKDVNIKNCALISSGRQSAEIVLKAMQSGIPIIASVAGPLESGIKIADAAGITLICFVRGRRMNVYTHLHRIS
jgi:FdhD protein